MTGTSVDLSIEALEMLDALCEERIGCVEFIRFMQQSPLHAQACLEHMIIDLLRDTLTEEQNAELLALRSSAEPLQ